MEDRARHEERQKEEEKRKEAAEAEAKKKAAKASGMGKKSRSETSMMSMAKKAIPARYPTNLFITKYILILLASEYLDKIFVFSFETKTFCLRPLNDYLFSF